MTRQLAEDIGGGIICVAAIGVGIATTPGWWIGALLFCLIVT